MTDTSTVSLSPPDQERREAAQRVYERLAGPYDFFFGPLLDRARRLAMDLLRIEPGARVLEVGIGTGLSLSLYPAGVRLAGIDPSPNMLAKARQRAEELGLEHVDLFEMSAEKLEFDDDAFDRVLASSVLSVVPHPGAALAEMARVVKPGGLACVVSHFAGRNRFERLLDEVCEPVTRRAFGYRMTTSRELVEASPFWSVEARHDLGNFNFSSAYVLRKRAAS
ncbi:MAG TPA: methyltransferase domain-containing protein [Thermoanaerobaculia bacterium]|jgi:phosphatidylethanolamine/phosphatidyl-N-methylethanolamine N-methyltransferase